MGPFATTTACAFSLGAQMSKVREGHCAFRTTVEARAQSAQFIMPRSSRDMSFGAWTLSRSLSS